MAQNYYFDEKNSPARNTKLPAPNPMLYDTTRKMPASFGARKEENEGTVYIKKMIYEYEVQWLPGATATDKPKMRGSRQAFILLFPNRRIEAYFEHPMEAIEYVQKTLNPTGRPKVCTETCRVYWVTEDGREIPACVVTKTRTKKYGIIGGEK